MYIGENLTGRNERFTVETHADDVNVFPHKPSPPTATDRLPSTALRPVRFPLSSSPTGSSEFPWHISVYPVAHLRFGHEWGGAVKGLGKESRTRRKKKGEEMKKNGKIEGRD